MSSPLVKKILGIPRANKRALALMVDSLLCVVSVLAAFYLRLGVWAFPVGLQWLSIILSLVIAIPLFVTFGFYRAIFRFAGSAALSTVVRVGLFYALIYSIIFVLIGVPGVPRTVGFIQPILLLLSVGASRAAVRFWLGGDYAGIMRETARKRVLIYGAGSAGRQLAAALANDKELEIIGFVDDDPTLHRHVLNGKTIYAPRNLAQLLEKHAIDDVLLAMPSASRRRRGEIISIIRRTKVGVRTLPSVMDLAQGRVTVNDLRPVEIEDLLGRDAVAPNETLLGKCITGKIVLVTGAGGSIGSELCRQILALEPSRLLLVEQNEFGLYAIQEELIQMNLNSSVEDVEIIPLLGSVCDERRMRRIMSDYRPDTVYHAAAYKHVPLVEQNPAEGVRNNVFGTLMVARMAEEFAVQDFVLISTDKAVRPTSIMGASKRCAELVLQALAANGGTVRFSMVRFGNVLGSSGSVVPLFLKQIRKGGPVTITHEEITRYFMTIPEAAQLVIQAGAMAEPGDVFVLDMGDPVRIIDLARKMIELSGLSVRDDDNPGGDMDILVTGLRPGEKLYEELLIGDNPLPTSHPRIMKASEPFLQWKVLNTKLTRMKADIEASDIDGILANVRELVPGFHRETLDGVEDAVDAAVLVNG
jgi:FlaA1/EpsC-like NDP-sugar epimerase